MDADPHPYRHICSTANESPNANAHINQTPIFQRIFQNLRATGVCSCSLYELDSKIFKPLPEPLLEKMLNFTAMLAIISQKEVILYTKDKKMQNTPRIFLNQNLESGKIFPVEKEVVHYLRRVMRRGDCLVFNNGVEYAAHLIDNDKNILIDNQTNHIDPSNNLTLCFAPIKKTDELLNMVTQLGVGIIQPVITERTVAHHINWERMKKIIVEAAEQSNRNSIPKLLTPIKFDDLDLKNLIVADERFAKGLKNKTKSIHETRILIGPEGGFSENEFKKLDNAGVPGLSLGKTILRAEVAAVVAVSKVLDE